MTEWLNAEWLNNGRLTYLFGFPLVMAVMLYLSALLGTKWQGSWLNSPLFAVLEGAPRPLRLIASSIAGAITPFCSCTTIPGFAAILEANLGVDTAMTFLLASPTVDPAGVLLLSLVFGGKLTLLYVVGCLVISVLIGWLCGQIFSGVEVNPVLLFGAVSETAATTWTEASHAARSYLTRFWWVIILSTLLGFGLYDYVPGQLVVNLSAQAGMLAIPLASILGLFIYAHMTVLVPIGAALIAKGIAPGMVIAFLASAAGISLPEIVLLRKIISLRLTIFYVFWTVTSIALLGFIVDWVGW